MTSTNSNDRTNRDELPAPSQTSAPSGHTPDMKQQLHDVSDSAVGLLDVPGLARRLGMTERFVRRLVAERRIPFYKIGKFIRFDPDRVDDWLEATEVERIA